MKVYKIIAYSSLAILLLTAIAMVSLPFQFPNSIIDWRSIILYSVPAIILVGLVFAKLILPLKPFRILLVILAVLAILATLVGWMAFIILGIFLIALGALYLPFGSAIFIES
jgi:hypothetical protein